MYLLSLESMTEVLIYFCLYCEVGHYEEFVDIELIEIALMIVAGGDLCGHSGIGGKWPHSY